MPEDNMVACDAIVPFAASGAAAKIQALADDRMQQERCIRFPEDSSVGQVVLQQMPGVALGAYAWNAGVELVKFLEHLEGLRLDGSSVLELGSGTGLTAIALAKLGAAVVATDCMPDLVKLARRNIAANDITVERCTAQLYDWGAPRRHSALLRAFDLVIASEVTALESGHIGLISTLRSLAEEAVAKGNAVPRVFLAETHRNDQQPMFWKEIKKLFAVVEAASIAQSDSWNTLGREQPIKIFELRYIANALAEEQQPEAPRESLPIDVKSADLVAEVCRASSQAYDDIFKPFEKLDAYTMCYDDLETFMEAGYDKGDIGKLSTYGCVLHQGVPLLFKTIALHSFEGDLHKATQDKTFLDLGSADARCVISAALSFVGLRKAIGIELSSARHELAEKHKARISDEAVAAKVELVHGDILSALATSLIADADIIYAANLRFPEEINQRLGVHITEAMEAEREYFVLVLAAVDFGKRLPSSSWEISVPMNWNPSGWPVFCHHFPRICS